MTVTLLLTSLVACGETGDTTSASGTGSTSTTTTTESTGETSSSTSEQPTSTGNATGTGTSEGTTTGTSTSEGATTGETTGTTTAVDSTGTTTGDSTTTTGEETSPLVIAIVDAYLTADCMPVIDPDPVQGAWYVEFDNTGNPNDTSAVVTQAWLSLAGGDPPVIEPMAVSPVESGPIAAGDYVSTEMIKLKDASHSACDHCDEFYKLVLVYDEGGVEHVVEEDVTISCVF